MLVLSRTPGERIIIADEIEITVVSVRGDRVRIGVKAPADIPVDRAEVWAQKQKQQTAPKPR